MTDTTTKRRGDDGTENWTREIFSMTPTRYNRIVLRSNLFNADLDQDDSDIRESTLDIHQDGPHIAFAQGLTARTNDGPEAYGYSSLTVEEAKDVRDALDDAIDLAEEAREQSSTGSSKDDDPESVIDRVAQKVMGR